MKILLAAPASRDTILGPIGLYCGEALRAMGHEVEPFDFRRGRLLGSRAGGLIKKAARLFLGPSVPRPAAVSAMEGARMNRELLAAAERFRPDVMLALLGDGITAGTLDRLRAAGTRTINWFPDSVLAPSRRVLLSEVASHYDHFFGIDSAEAFCLAGLKARRVATLPLGCCPSVHRRMELTSAERSEYGSELAFVGTVKFVRAGLLAAISDLGLGIWGNWQREEPALKGCYRDKHVFGEEAVKIYNAAKIVVDIHEHFNEDQELFNVTPRVFEVPACGALLLTNYNPALAGLYEPGTELVCYKDAADLREKVKYYLVRPAERAAIAERGRLRALREHTYALRMKKLLDAVTGKDI